MDPATKKRLKKAYKSMDKYELQDVLDYCEQEGFVTDMTRKCTELLNKICDADEVCCSTSFGAGVIDCRDG